jgi:hypothetical protein
MNPKKTGNEQKRKCLLVLLRRCALNAAGKEELKVSVDVTISVMAPMNEMHTSGRAFTHPQAICAQSVFPRSSPLSW